MKRWLVSIMIATNQLANAITGGNPQESISSRAAHARAKGSKFGAAMCKVLDVFDIHHHDPDYPDGADHCEIAMIDHERRLTENLNEERSAAPRSRR